MQEFLSQIFLELWQKIDFGVLLLWGPRPPIQQKLNFFLLKIKFFKIRFDIRIGLFSTNTPHLNIAILVLKSSLWVLVFWGPWTLNKNFKRFRFFIGKVLKIRFCRGIVCFCTFDITANITKSLDKTSASDRTIRDRPTTVLSLVSVGFGLYWDEELRDFGKWFLINKLVVF